MCNVAGIFVQRHMPVMWIVCISVLLFTLLIVLSSYGVFTDIVVSYLYMN